MHGWGHTMKEFEQNGTWINTEKNWHINPFGLKSILLSLISIVKDHEIHEIQGFFR